jgi:hypothetical protein
MTASTSNPSSAPQPPRSARAFTTPIVGNINGHVVATSWSYTTDQPHAVKVLLRTASGSALWEFARTLLTDLTSPAGDPLHGDVTFCPLDDITTALKLSSPDGLAQVLLDTEALGQFRNRTYALCRPGQEPDADLSSVENVLRAAAETTGGDW